MATEKLENLESDGIYTGRLVLSRRSQIPINNRTGEQVTETADYFSRLGYRVEGFR